MKMGLWVTGPRYLVVMLVIGSVMALGCSGKSDRDDDDDTGGSSGGGFGGLGGKASCVNVCERLEVCQGEVLECGQSCAALAMQPCAAEAYRVFDCLEGYDVCAVTTSVCVAELDAYALCSEGGGVGGGSCSPASAPSSVSCSVICSRLASCPDAAPDCALSCEEAVGIAATAGCTLEYQAALGCLSTCTDPCNLTGDECAASVNSYLYCEENFCALNPSSTICI